MKHDEIMQTLRSACAERMACSLRIKEEEKDRDIHPYGICFSKKDKLILVCVLANPSPESRNPSRYRNFLVENIESVELMMDEQFSVSRDFNPFSSQYSGWLFHVLKLA